MSLLERVHRIHPLLRWPAKLVLFILITGLVLYPKWWLLPTWIARLGNLNSVIDPSHPALAELEQRVREKLPADAPPADLLKAVERVVYERIPYAWDWDTWGVMEYLPTTAEVFEVGREDCDGRAVVAASLLRRLGVEAWLVADLLHMWVETPQGETMSPTGGEKTLSARPTDSQPALRTRLTVSAELVRNLARGFSYGVAVFPLLREVLILAALCLLTVHPWSSGWRRISGVLLCWIALDLLRDVGRQAAMQMQAAAVAQAVAAVLLALTAWLVLAFKAAGSPARSRAAQPV